ncbi:MAG: ribosomal RNA small subunit methyltransferase A [candidate division Zixibacteria bacterium HGW-Zixibacteria-1]|nr:MAG: ribosomal RNA small subunit methyltransferase A [candidate division Zixibacteria bacterium HGW-Zixibacteria-1]
MARPKKRFSQNFLVDDNIAERIVGLLDIHKEDAVFEIGSGRGMLTRLIAETGARLYSFEIDTDLVHELQPRFKNYPNVNIVNIDFLIVEPFEKREGGFKLIGNIPYDITSPIIDWITRYHKYITRAVITAQKELADRISSGPGSRNWAPISIFAQCYYNITSALTIPPGAFTPKPKVYSSTLLFEPREAYRIDDWDFFENVVRASFRNRRKLLTNNLADFEGLKKDGLEKILDRAGLPKLVRAEQIDIEQFILLSKLIKTSVLS